MGFVAEGATAITAAGVLSCAGTGSGITGKPESCAEAKVGFALQMCFRVRVTRGIQSTKPPVLARM
jgi:hypothetical protein